MASQRRTIDIDIDDMPEVSRLVEEVTSSQEPRRLRLGKKVVAELKPLRVSKGGRPKAGRAKGAMARKIPAGEVLLGLAGIGKSEPGSLGSGNKHEALLEAYYKHHRA